MVKVLTLAALLLLTACQTTGGSFCAVSKPLRFTEATIDRMTDAEVNAALAHNQKLAKLCRVKP